MSQTKALRLQAARSCVGLHKWSYLKEYRGTLNPGKKVFFFKHKDSNFKLEVTRADIIRYECLHNLLKQRYQTQCTNKIKKSGVSALSSSRRASRKLRRIATRQRLLAGDVTRVADEIDEEVAMPLEQQRTLLDELSEPDAKPVVKPAKHAKPAKPAAARRKPAAKPATRPLGSNAVGKRPMPKNTEVRPAR